MARKKVKEMNVSCAENGEVMILKKDSSYLWKFSNLTCSSLLNHKHIAKNEFPLFNKPIEIQFSYENPILILKCFTGIQPPPPFKVSIQTRTVTLVGQVYSTNDGEFHLNVPDLCFTSDLELYVFLNFFQERITNELATPLEYSAYDKECMITSNDVLVENLKEMYQKELHCDVTIQVEAQKFKSHKCILSSRSAVFAAMFEHDMAEKNKDFVNVTDCNPSIFEKFLLYLYTSNVEMLTKENTFGLYAVADKYNVCHLKVECANYLKKNLSNDIFCDVINLAVVYNESELLEWSKKYFENNARNILLEPNWHLLLKEHADVANELLLLVVK